MVSYLKSLFCDTFVLILIYSMIVVRTALYPTLTYNIYSGIEYAGVFADFVLFMKVGIARYTAGDAGRSLPRMLVFNLIRQMLPSVWPHLLLGSPLPDLELL